MTRWAGLAGGPLLALATYALLPDTYRDQDGAMVAFSHAGRATAAVAAWMAVWWLTEAVDLTATALIPLVALPLLGATTMAEASAPYANDLIFLFMGGFIMSLAMQRWDLHRRVALRTLALVGPEPPKIIGGFMATTAGLSMWLSNTATAVMMLPIAQSVIAMRRDGLPVAPRQADGGRDEFAPAMMLGIAYAASIGGIATLVGSPPNVIFASYARDQLGIDVSFAEWMSFGVPLAATMLAAAWVLLTRLQFHVDRGGALNLPATELPPLGRGARATTVVFAAAVILWLTRPLLVNLEVAGVRPFAGLTDSGIAMTAALSLFLIPVDLARRTFVMDWDHAVRLPWGILLLFGGGLSLAAAVDRNGVGTFLGAQVSAWRGLHPLLLLALVSAMVLFLTELTSNTATAATLVPLFGSLAPGLGVHPLLLVLPTAVAASWAFMLPAATPPNAIVFGSGDVTIQQMRTAGLRLNVIGLALLTALMYWVALPMLGVPRSM